MGTNGASRAAIRHFRQDILAGKHWYLALLEAVGRWQMPEETVTGRRYRYLIAGEAFDWLLLAQRLTAGVDGLIPPQEREALLRGYPPITLSEREFRSLIGPGKYRFHLNFFYGVVVEEALQAAVAEGVRKENNHFRYLKDDVVREEVSQRIYGGAFSSLLQQFRRERRLRRGARFTHQEWKAFVYWLFKYRVAHCEKARVASDTKKGLDWLRRRWEGHLPVGRIPTAASSLWQSTSLWEGSPAP